MNRALAARTAPLGELERAFEAFARQRANRAPTDVDALAAAAARARKQGDVADERRALEALVRVSANRGSAYDRLLELATATNDPRALEVAARGMLAVNPMAIAGWRGLGRAMEARPGDGESARQAVAAYQKVLLLDPPDPADVHLRLGRLLLTSDPRTAKRHVLDALAEAPRFREAHRLLLQLQGGKR